MTADSYLEFFLVFLGWIINSALWTIFTSTGLFALPLVLKIVGIWLKVRTEGDDEGNKGTLALPRIEQVVYVAFVVILFCAMPFKDVDLSTMKFDRTRSTTCGINVPRPDESGYSGFLTDFNGQVAKVPMWWYLVHNLSKGITHAAIASIPCGTQLRQLRFEVQHTQLIDPVIRQEVQEFATQCYSKAYFKLKSTNGQLTDATINSIGWIGSSYFLTNTGYYGYYTSISPRSQWSYNNKRDSGYPDVGQGGYPTCKEWWSTPKSGLKARLLTAFDNRTVNMMKARDPSHWEENLLRWLVSPQNTLISAGGETYMTGSQRGTGANIDTGLKQMISGLGTFSAQVTQLPAFDALRQALPMVHGILIMAMVICIPLVMLLGAYDPKVVVTLTLAMFAMIFVTFWWELAGWLDDRLIEIIYSGGRGYYNWFMSIGSEGWIMNLVLGSMFLVLPAFWFGAIGWSGIQIGVMVSQSVSSGSKTSQQAGAVGGQIVTNVAKTVITKGK
ncbi:conjugal transfer protein TraG N-terminal domain-containing protein [Yersinia enterocolitica]|nr:conjugal transfer protein TraG N-terminal domain-containing protein [Yersinia enterocolitica]EKN3939899.1 conjugal transfer protein TraG N-terminal domain-containing protein [Yersinia enterocolitica]EKN4900051.1 conjugal transfer protein TraG N-terminal domain-containing protein [Yersinia enterocolitica]EKN6084570.1 conjugal transfer protein TraG [Yersinia enterocolitica]ELI7918220.1 conjugal transfer protein TraG N-terminal domain-containing protein [Yersinia enterocolitica]